MMDGRTALAQGVVPGRYFDCRRYLKQGDSVEFCMDGKDLEMFNGIAKVRKVYKDFVILSGRYTDITVNRWSITAVNGRKTKGGCFRDIPTLHERRMRKSSGGVE
jgi:hypothetical protein